MPPVCQRKPEHGRRRHCSSKRLLDQVRVVQRDFRIGVKPTRGEARGKRQHIPQCFLHTPRRHHLEHGHCSGYQGACKQHGQPLTPTQPRSHCSHHFPAPPPHPPQHHTRPLPPT